MAAENGFSLHMKTLDIYGITVRVERQFLKRNITTFSKGAECSDDYLRIGYEHKIADMYHYRYFIKKNEDIYKATTEKVYVELSHPENLNSIIPMKFLAIPAINYRIAKIRTEQNKVTVEDVPFKTLSVMQTAVSYYCRLSAKQRRNQISLETIVGYLLILFAM